MDKQYLSRWWRWVYALVCLLLFFPLPTHCAEPILPVLQVQSGKLTGLVLDHEITQETRLRDKACDVLDRAIQDVYNKPPAGK